MLNVAFGFDGTLLKQRVSNTKGRNSPIDSVLHHCRLLLSSHSTICIDCFKALLSIASRHHLVLFPPFVWIDSIWKYFVSTRDELVVGDNETGGVGDGVVISQREGFGSLFLFLQTFFLNQGI